MRFSVYAFYVVGSFFCFVFWGIINLVVEVMLFVEEKVGVRLIIIFSK